MHFSNSGKKVKVLSSLVPEDEENRIYQQLAEGEIDIVISSGKAAEGVDIKKTDGVFPDLHISIFGLPVSRLKLRQTLGRRRAPEDDFSWYLAKTHLQEALSSSLEIINVFQSPEKELKKNFKDLQKKDGQQLDLNTAYEYIKSLERLRVSDDEWIIFSDRLFDLFKPQIEESLRRYFLEKKQPIFIFGLPEIIYCDFIASFTQLTPAELSNLFQQRQVFFDPKYKDENLINHPLLKPLKDLFLSSENIQALAEEISTLNNTIGHRLVYRPTIVGFGEKITLSDSSNKFLSDKKSGDVFPFEIDDKTYLVIYLENNLIQRIFSVQNPNDSTGKNIVLDKEDKNCHFQLVVFRKSPFDKEIYILFTLN